MSYILCPFCGEASGCVGTYIFQCRCARERQGKGISGVGLPMELEGGKAVLPDSGSGNIAGNSNHYFRQVRLDTMTEKTSEPRNPSSEAGLRIGDCYYCGAETSRCLEVEERTPTDRGEEVRRTESFVCETCAREQDPNFAALAKEARDAGVREGTMVCPICGIDKPHGHDKTAILDWLVAQGTRFGVDISMEFFARTGRLQDTRQAFEKFFEATLVSNHSGLDPAGTYGWALFWKDRNDMRYQTPQVETAWLIWQAALAARDAAKETK